MKSNIETVLTWDFLKTWFKAFRRNPLVMLNITLLMVIALVAMFVVRVWRLIYLSMGSVR